MKTWLTLIYTVVGAALLGAAFWASYEYLTPVELEPAVEESPLLSSPDIVKVLLASKYSIDSAMINVTLTAGYTDFLAGQAAIAAVGGMIERNFLAVKQADEWQLAFDGDTAVPCAVLRQYNAPAAMVTGCHKAEDRAIRVVEDDVFTIDLEANAATGYSWEAEFDTALLELVSREYTAHEASASMVGSSGIETFTFKALEVGDSEIHFSYSRSWEEEPPAQEEVRLVIIGEKE